MPDSAGNSLDRATAIALTPSVQSFPDRVVPALDDYYRLTVVNRSSFYASLSGLTGDANIALLDSAGVAFNINDVSQSSTNPGTTPEVLHTILAPGTYYIQVSAAPSVSSADYRLNVAATDVPEPTRTLADLQGLVWNDVNGNGIREAYEPGLANWTVYLDQNRNGQLDPSESFMATNADGSYRFAGLAAGTYIVAQVLESGWQSTAIPSNFASTSQTIVLDSGTTAVGIDFSDRVLLPTISLTPKLTGVSNPVFVTNAGDGSDRLFVVEQSGRIRVAQNGTLLPTPFLDIRSRVLAGGEQGLLSVAFPPGYADKQHFYVYYTNAAGNLVIARYGLTADPNVADSNSEQIIITINHPTNTNHNGGQLAFGPDGYLYIGTGDGGGAGDPNNNAQNLASLLGKILRIDVESPGTTSYTIPRTNPFLTTTDPTNQYRDEIWALGLRNPWRFSFDRQAGDLYIADVGQSAYEEVNFQPAASLGGENYGWRILEGSFPYRSNGNDTNGLVLPVAEYDHTQGISVTGGYVYRGLAAPRLQGIYLYGDFANGKIWGLRPSPTGWETQLLLDSPYGISSFGEDEQGNLYVADYSGGGVYQVTV